MMKYLLGSSARPLPMKTCSIILLVPEYQVGTRIALSLVGLRVPNGRVGKLAIADHAAFFQFETTNIVQFVRAVGFLRIVAVADHCRPPVLVEFGRGRLYRCPPGRNSCFASA